MKSINTPTLKQIEEYLQNIIFPELEKGRPNWDKPHTEAVVYHMKQIIAEWPSTLDELVLVITAYCHDWGYVGLFLDGKPLSNKDVSDKKEAHMLIGAEKTKNLLENSFFDFLTNSQKNRVVHLVGIHDKKDSLKDTDEILFMEADTLGGLDLDFVNPSFDSESNEKYMNSIVVKRLPKFISNYGKEKFSEFYNKRKEFYENKK